MDIKEVKKELNRLRKESVIITIAITIMMSRKSLIMNMTSLCYN